MNLRDQVCSLELSEKLHDLNFNLEGVYSYGDFQHTIFDEDCLIFLSQNVSPGKRLGYAYTSSELIAMLPYRITIEEGAPFNSFRFRIMKSKIIRGYEDALQNNKNNFFPITNDMIITTYLINYYCDTYALPEWADKSLLLHNICDENFSNSLAKTLIKLLEDKLITIDELKQ